MNYGQVRDATLKLLNQYTVAGERVAESYNNQDDYIKRIPTLVNDAMMEIATTTRKILSTLNLGELPQEEVNKHQVSYILPEDFYQLVSGSVVTSEEGHILHTNQYTVLGRKCLIVPKKEAGNYTISYYRYPTLLDEDPADTDALDNEPETHYAIPFYVAAYLVDHDDMSLAALFNNKYEDKLSKLSAGVYAETHPTKDVYNFFW